MPSVAQWINVGAAQYLTTARTALEMSIRVWVDSRTGEPTNSRDDEFPVRFVIVEIPKSRANRNFLTLLLRYSVLVRRLFS